MATLCHTTRTTPGLLVPADDGLPVRACTLGSLGYVPDGERGDTAAITVRRQTLRTRTDWACTYTTPLARMDTWRLTRDRGLACWELLVDDYARHDVPMPVNRRATMLCALRGPSGGYEVRGDAFLCARLAGGTGWHTAAVPADVAELLRL